MCLVITDSFQQSKQKFRSWEKKIWYIAIKLIFSTCSLCSESVNFNKKAMQISHNTSFSPKTTGWRELFWLCAESNCQRPNAVAGDCREWKPYKNLFLSRDISRIVGRRASRKNPSNSEETDLSKNIYITVIKCTLLMHDFKSL